MEKAQTFGIWGCLILGVVILVTTAMKGGLDDPVQFTGGASLILIGGAFWLFKKSAEQAAAHDDGDEKTKR